MIAHRKVTPTTVVVSLAAGVVLAGVVSFVVFAWAGCAQSTDGEFRDTFPPPTTSPKRTPPATPTPKLNPPPAVREYVVQADQATTCDGATHGVRVSDDCFAKRAALVVWHGDKLWSAQDCATDPTGESCQFFAQRATVSVGFILDLFEREPCSARALQAADVNASGCLDLFDIAVIDRWRSDPDCRAGNGCDAGV